MNERIPAKKKDEEHLLIQKAIKRDASAFGRLYDMYVDRIYRYVYYRVGSVADAEDLTQQVFLKAWQAIGRYKKMASPFIAWLMTISHNVIIDFYRTRKSNACIGNDITSNNLEYNPEKAAEAQLEQKKLRQAILQLSSDRQQVVILRLIEGFQFREIASILGKSEGAVRVILHRALTKLQEILGKEKGYDKK